MSRSNSRADAKPRLAGIPIPLPGGKAVPPVLDTLEPSPERPTVAPAPPTTGPELPKTLVDLRGTARFVLYLADHIEDTFKQFPAKGAKDDMQPSIERRLLEMYATELVSKSQTLGNLTSNVARELRGVLRDRDHSGPPKS